MRRSLFLLVGFVSSALAVQIGDFNYSQAELDEMSNALSAYEQLANRAISQPSRELIPSLATGLLKTGQPNIYVVGDRSGIHELLRRALLSTPGHAEYYRDKINEARQKMEEARGNVGDFPHYKSNLQSTIRFDFPIFQELPSPETVRVLGEFLFDERGYVRIDNPKTEDDLFKAIAEGPVFGRAAESLLKLPIEHKPVADTKYPGYHNPEDVLPWREWIEEIKAGKRTFRFKGDPTEYDLNGPAPKQKLERIALTQRRDNERSSRHDLNAASGDRKDSIQAHQSTPPLIIGVVFGLALAGCALWYFYKRPTA